MFILILLFALYTALAVLLLSCCAVSGMADRRATEIYKRREGRCPGENHTLTPAGSTPAPATPTQP